MQSPRQIFIADVKTATSAIILLSVFSSVANALIRFLLGDKDLLAHAKCAVTGSITCGLFLSSIIMAMAPGLLNHVNITAAHHQKRHLAIGIMTAFFATEIENGIFDLLHVDHKLQQQRETSLGEHLQARLQNQLTLLAIAAPIVMFGAIGSRYLETPVNALAGLAVNNAVALQDNIAPFFTGRILRRDIKDKMPHCRFNKMRTD